MTLRPSAAVMRLSAAVRAGIRLGPAPEDVLATSSSERSALQRMSQPVGRSTRREPPTPRFDDSRRHAGRFLTGSLCVGPTLDGGGVVMADLVMLAVTVAFFVFGFALVVWMDRI